MSKKRFHFDKKGNLKGYSSDKLSVREASQGGLLGLFLIALIGFCSTDNEEKRARTDGSEPVKSQAGEISAPSGLATVDESTIDISERAIVQPSAPMDEPESTGQVVRSGQSTTEEYLDKTYYNGNPSCPRDIIEYYIKLCEEGDEQSCQSVDKC